MNNATHEKRIQKIETECVELRKQILQLEFQQKKDIHEFEKRSKVKAEEDERRRKESDKEWERTKKHLRHLSQLAGITFERLEELDERLESASVSLSRKDKKSI